MKKIMAAAAVLLAVASSSGCGVGWFDNQPETPKPAAEACAIAAKKAPNSEVSAELPGDGWKTRPGDVPAERAWILVGVNIRASDPVVDFNFNYCVATYIKITVDVLEEDAFIEGREGARVYEFDTVTPWVNHYVPFDYDPTEERFKGRPPRYLVKVEATYVPGLGDIPAPREMLCELKIFGASVADAHWPPSEGPVYCAVTTNRYNPPAS